MSVRGRARQFAARAPDPATLARLGLGLMLVAAGTHKLLDPAGWTVYVTDWLAPWIVVSPRVFVLANGWLELGFAALLLADRWTAFAALVAAVSLTATVGYLAVVWAATGQFGDVLARDVGLVGLAFAVLVDALRPESGTRTGKLP
ncbi:MULTISPECIES: DoxX family protein [Halobacterium]|uniref:DoxX family protein n=1 Tax=Halobacterium TaxID=2239 RepID=UPI0009EBF5AA|nr:MULTISPECIES: DoxX family protein [Halobacterium]MCG1002445.1 DoxX family protein [Halobacterium noricense]